MNDTLKLVIIGKVDPYISYLSRRTFVNNLAMDYDDLVSEGRTKVLEVIYKYEYLPMQELVAVCIKAVSNLYGVLVRRSKRDRNSGIIIDLEEAFQLADGSQLHQIYVDMQMRQLVDMFNHDERKILECFLNPPEELVEKVRSKYSSGVNPEVKFTKSVIASYLGMSRSYFRSVITGMHSKAVLVFEL